MSGFLSTLFASGGRTKDPIETPWRGYLKTSMAEEAINS